MTFVEFTGAPTGIPAGIPDCNDPGWVHLQLAEPVFDADTGGCFGDPAPAAAGGKQRKNPDGPQTNFSPTTHYFFSIDGVLYNFVWQCAQIT